MSTGLHPADLALLADRHLGVLITLKRDGRPQSSNIGYAYDADAQLVRISVTADRAKTKNLLRDPRANLHVMTPDGWSWMVAEGIATLTPVAQDPHDATVDELSSSTAQWPVSIQIGMSTAERW